MLDLVEDADCEVGGAAEDDAGDGERDGEVGGPGVEIVGDEAIGAVIGDELAERLLEELDEFVELF